MEAAAPSSPLASPAAQQTAAFIPTMDSHEEATTSNSAAPSTEAANGGTAARPTSADVSSSAGSALTSARLHAYSPSQASRHEKVILLGVAARDRKARSKPMSQILNRIISNKEIACQIVNFGDKVLLDEPPESWPVVDVLISFFSDGFPLDKAIAYADLRKPVLVNDLRFQAVLWDRRAVLAILDSAGVPTPRRLEADKDGGPVLDKKVLEDVKKRLGLEFRKRPVKNARLKENDVDTLIVGDQEISKPFVEKPVSGEDHNVHIYFHSSKGGGGRRLFRKVGNKSSEYDPNLVQPRTDGSYIYEEFMDVDNAEDVKVYTIGPYFVHAETRKSPVVDGLVKRNPDGKEIRYITKLTEAEVKMATNISKAFKQNICGFDLLRVGDKSYVIDVNGWSFVKGNDFYYDKCASILASFCKMSAPRRSASLASSSSSVGSAIDGREAEQSSWTLKSSATVFRHGDRTPKQKLKRSFKPKDAWAAPLLALLQGRKEEIILRSNLDMVSKAATEAMQLPGAKKHDLTLVIGAIERKQDLPGTKVQMKPSFDTDGNLEKMQLIIKWGGEFSHAARHQARDLGSNLRRDMIVQNANALRNCTIYTSSERRVTASAETFASYFLDEPEDPQKNPLQLVIRKDLLDDSNASKTEMDVVKKQLKAVLKPDGAPRPSDWPEDAPSPPELCQQIAQTLRSLQATMLENYEKMDVNSISRKWCTAESPELFRERWAKLFADYEDDPYDPSRASELYDMLTHDGLHNRTFVETIFAAPDVPQEKRLDRLHELYRLSSTLFSWTCPAEYGVTSEQKESIGVLTSMPLLMHIIADLKAAESKPLCALYFTKESHMHTLLNLILASDLPILTNKRPPLDYLSCIAFEVYEKTTTTGTAANSPRPSSGDGSSNSNSSHGAAPAGSSGNSSAPMTPNPSNTPPTPPERSLLISVSPGAHSSEPFFIKLDARHSLSPLPRQPLTRHMPLDEGIAALSNHKAVEANRGQVEGETVFSGLPHTERGLLHIKRRGSDVSSRASVAG
ncbi:putative VIP1-actin cytoskeleton organization and biogenesis-related protein [Ceraceosorus guamensis]|uniref:Inositol hexakisphosphate and diphosphoinositol-pentakisphosphate kinase n=1 Tax=Ceraceosorus guamensis TaxID=1522189 RepID=A0A316WB90_9BASI|nr:putative VIP1-actin cytoskeleton organization and biogenesis-related protein [Ceraceosorus guamensis]PWN46228.1 putative VIP1-actin cytoskeleton organization and biogenesis-related protein [Ceraceosorus guamensis]